MDGELAKCGESIFLPWHLFNHGTESEASRNLLPSRVNRELRSNGQTCKGAAEPLVVELLGSAELVGCALTTSHRVVRLFFGGLRSVQFSVLVAWQVEGNVIVSGQACCK